MRPGDAAVNGFGMIPDWPTARRELSERGARRRFALRPCACKTEGGCRSWHGKSVFDNRIQASRQFLFITLNLPSVAWTDSGETSKCSAALSMSSSSDSPMSRLSRKPGSGQSGFHANARGKSSRASSAVADGKGGSQASSFARWSPWSLANAKRRLVPRAPRKQTAVLSCEPLRSPAESSVSCRRPVRRFLPSVASRVIRPLRPYPNAFPQVLVGDGRKCLKCKVINPRPVIESL